MKIISVKFTAWDTPYYFLSKDEHNNDLDLKIGDKVLVETIIGIDIGEVSEIKDVEDDNSIKPIIHIATEDDLNVVKKNNSNVKKILKEIKLLAKKYELDMKLSDIHISYDDKMMIISFISDGRVDFRELVKVLSKKYKRKIRLYQLGVRDEAKFCGDIGDCGQVLCCKRFLKKLESINTGFARDQQVAHRGLDKLSGMCGRLKCCLAYEEDLYQEILKDMPEIGEKFKTKHGLAEVIELLPLKNSIKVRLDSDRSIIIVELTK
ncbi:MAG: regulatory iron-sulfur-containing complex subunit RicT [Patescibacteria group bacterium]|nr:regulatory iron-sulfur-containing complex subunit RicT [Patescibacteria group bacterium]MDD4304863.1 regulatory iron-sulfur-containing complex subunit RicT [Patescibacteria group bacterium]MDD4695837.1 regulatory iron-sulfur-containing complex subunit RicT [Patescibacteria group bacterium]